jgi:hypothetical protein
MPYIKQSRRDAIFSESKTDFDNTLQNAGELNYYITEIISSYLEKHGLNYQTCNDIVGALDNAKDEFRRRIQHPYEDEKIQINGDVYNISSNK